MSLTTKEFIYNQIKSKNLAFYVIKNNAGTQIYDQLDGGTYTADEVIKMIDNTFNSINDIVKLEIKDRNDLNKGGKQLKFTYMVDCRNNISGIGNTYTAPIQQQTDNYLKEWLSERETTADLRMKIQELNWEIKQLKEDDNISGTDDEDTKAFFRETMNFVKELKNPNQNPQPTAAPIGNTESSEKKPNEMTSLLMRWKDADADVLYTVMMIVNIAENNPLVYEAAKAQLKQYN